jgi:hypothetical protein
MEMKKLITICLVCVLTTAAWGTLNITFDENGNGSWQNGDANGTLGYGSSFPPGPYELGMYTLTPLTPSTIVGGEVLIYEDALQTVISDYLLFYSEIHPVTGQLHSWVYVYSDIEGTPLIDVGGYANVVKLTEEGTEAGWNGVHYTPGVTDPGYIPGGVTYNFTSDVPEPVTICLLGLGALSLIRRKRRT